MELKETEGVIKYKLDYSNRPLTDEVLNHCISRISMVNAWRRILKQLGLIGQEPSRYGGLGFGNMSIRLQPNSHAFLITGTQTGILEQLQQQHFSLVTSANTAHNNIIATGETQPSSEALTHASLYSAASVEAVIHIHYPPIWRLSRQLKLPIIEKNITYGTPEMANAVARLMQSQPKNQPVVFSMLGHEDGIIAYGTTVDAVALSLMKVLALAYQRNDIHL